MIRRLLTMTLLGLLAVPLAAQAPEGWKVRIDRSTSAQDPDDTPNLKFAAMGKGFHVTGGPAGTFWNPANTAKGDFTAAANFTLIKPSGHVNYYGLVFGGADLEGGDQNYFYFIVAQDGTFQVRPRSATVPVTKSTTSCRRLRTMRSGSRAPTAARRTRWRSASPGTRSRTSSTGPSSARRRERACSPGPMASSASA
jgi:hypothetical protein